jgi:hypothetical protein
MCYEIVCRKPYLPRPVINGDRDNHQSIQTTDTIIPGCQVKKILRHKTVRRLHILTSLNPEIIDNHTLRCNSRNNIHTDRGFVLQINVSRQHRFFILKKILGSTGATGARENTLFGDHNYRSPDNDTNPNRSPSQVVISAFGMVIWVILWLSATGFLFRDDNEIFINLP